MIWDVLFKEWRDDQKIKKEKEKNELGKKRVRKMTKDKITEQAKSPEEAVMNSSKFGKKLNQNKIKNYLFKRSKAN